MSSLACCSAFLTAAKASSIGRSSEIASRNAFEEPFVIVDFSKENGMFMFFATCTAAANWRTCPKPFAAAFKSVSRGSRADNVAFSFAFLFISANVLFELPLQPEADVTRPQSARLLACPIADMPSIGIAKATAASFITLIILLDLTELDTIQRTSIPLNSCSKHGYR
jgi:hypothetical protein